MPDDITADATAAYDALASGASEDSAIETSSPEASAAGSTSQPAHGAESASVSEKSGRDKSGRFVSSSSGDKSAAANEDAQATQQPKEGEESKTAQPKQGAADLSKPPPGLGPLARAKWDATPQEVREDLWRREKETAQALRSSSEARQFREAFDKVTAPYASHFRAAGVDPVTGTQALYDAFGRLSGPDKLVAAQQAAHLIQSYGIPLELMNQALGFGGDETQASAQPARLPPEVANELAEMRQKLGSIEQQRQAATEQYAARTISEFARTHEHYEDVRQDMSRLVASGYDLEDAYQMAVMKNPQTREAFTRSLSDAASKRQEETVSRARAASVSPKSTPVSSFKPSSSGNIYDDARAAYEALLSNG